VKAVRDSGVYNVKFGRTARSLVYEDQEGSLLFGFDISPASNAELGKWLIQLGSTPLTEQCKPIEFPVSKERLSFATEKTKQFLLSRGYQVETL
jgi:hypothetical protein